MESNTNYTVAPNRTLVTLLAELAGTAKPLVVCGVVQDASSIVVYRSFILSLLVPFGLTVLYFAFSKGEGGVTKLWELLLRHFKSLSNTALGMIKLPSKITHENAQA